LRVTGTAVAILVLSLLTVLGCATTEQSVALPDDNVALSKGEVGRIVLTRDAELLGAVYRMKVYDGDALLGKISTGDRMYWDRPPGLARLRMTWLGIDPPVFLLNVDGGTEYRLGLSPYSGFYVAAHYPPATTARPGPQRTGESATRLASGFAVGKSGLIVTAYHVVERAVDIHVRFPGGEWLAATVVKHSESNDVAILECEGEVPSALCLDSGLGVRQADRVFTFGFPVPDLLGVEPKYAEGTVGAASGPTGHPSLIQISVPIQPGNSGGPLLNEKGHVVGMIISSAAVEWFYAKTGALPQGLNYAVNAAVIRPLLGDDYQDGSVSAGGVVPPEEVRASVCLVRAERS